MHKIASICLLVLCGALSGARGEKPTYVVSPVEQAGPMAPGAAESFRQALVRRMCAHETIRVAERKRLKLVLDEQMLRLAVSPGEDATDGMAGLKAGLLVVPGVCRVEQDYILSVRVIDLKAGSVRACYAQRTRLVSEFGGRGVLLADRVVAGKKPRAGAAAGRGAMSPAGMRGRCKDVRADVLFPLLWRRCEALHEKVAAGSDAAELADYYLHLLEFCIQASQPPSAMVFVPGGYVSVATSAGERKLWVEPFFLDRCEVTVGAYAAFLADLSRTGGGAAGLRPITAGMAAFNASGLPVTGIGWSAAAKYAKWRGRSLPTWLQWLRATRGETGRAHPCEGSGRLSGCNLAGAGDGYAVLAPAGKCGSDVCAFGAMGLTGNVREWTSTWYRRDMYSRDNSAGPAEPETGTLKIVAGGSWRSDKAAAACGRFDRVKPGEAFDDVGLRCAAGFWAVLKRRREAGGAKPAAARERANR